MAAGAIDSLSYDPNDQTDVGSLSLSLCTEKPNTISFDSFPSSLFGTGYLDSYLTDRIESLVSAVQWG